LAISGGRVAGGVRPAVGPVLCLVVLTNLYARWFFLG
jgi:hypothetical protein